MTLLEEEMRKIHLQIRKSPRRVCMWGVLGVWVALLLEEKPSGLVLIHINYPEVNVDGVFKLFLKNIYVKWKMQIGFVIVLLFIKFSMH